MAVASRFISSPPTMRARCAGLTVCMMRISSANLIAGFRYARNRNCSVRKNAPTIVRANTNSSPPRSSSRRDNTACWSLDRSARKAKKTAPAVSRNNSVTTESARANFGFKRMGPVSSDVSEQLAHFGDQTLGRERLGDVRVGAESEPFAHFGIAPLSGKHDDARVLPFGRLTDPLAHLEAVLQRQHHVEQDEIGPELR